VAFVSTTPVCRAAFIPSSTVSGPQLQAPRIHALCTKLKPLNVDHVVLGVSSDSPVATTISEHDPTNVYKTETARPIHPASQKYSVTLYMKNQRACKRQNDASIHTGREAQDVRHETQGTKAKRTASRLSPNLPPTCSR